MALPAVPILLLLLVQFCAPSLSAFITLPSTLPNPSSIPLATNTNITIAPPSLLSHRPPTDPYIIHATPTIRLRISSYGRPISPIPMLTILLDASAAVIAALRNNPSGDDVIQHHLGYNDGDAVLSLLPTPWMTWATWGACLQALGAFVERWEGMEMMFTVQEGGRDVGVGGFGLV